MYYKNVYDVTWFQKVYDVIMISVAACLMMVLDENLSYEEASQKLKALRGNGAIQSVKVYRRVIYLIKKCIFILLWNPQPIKIIF